MGFLGSYGGTYFGTYMGSVGGSAVAQPGAPRPVALFTDDVLLLIRQQLVDHSLAADEYVFVSLEPDPPGDFPPCDLFLVVVPGPQRPEQGIINGADPQTITPVVGQFGVVVWKRADVDQDTRDTVRLTSASLGALRVQRRVLKALQQWDAADADGNAIFCEPMRLSDSGFDCKPRRPRSGWFSVSSVFECNYAADMVS